MDKCKTKNSKLNLSEQIKNLQYLAKEMQKVKKYIIKNIILY